MSEIYDIEQGMNFLTAEKFWNFDRLVAFLRFSPWIGDEDKDDISLALFLLSRVDEKDKHKVRFVQKRSYCGGGNFKDGSWGYYNFFFDGIIVADINHYFDILGKWEVHYDWDAEKQILKYNSEKEFISEIKIGELKT